MTKQEWIAVIKRTLKKVDESSILRDALIERHIQSVYEQMYNELYRSNPYGFSKYTTIIDYQNTGVNTEGLSTGVTIPTLPINLPRENGGVFEVWLVGTTPASEIIMTSYDAYRMVQNSSFDTVSAYDKRFASVQKDTIHVNVNLPPLGILRMRLIPKFTALSATDEVIIPDGHEEMLIDRVIDTVQHMTPSDLINDNNAG